LMCLLSFAVAHMSQAQWSNDPSVNTEVNTWSDVTSVPVIAPDGEGGVFIVWTIENDDIRVQHLDKQGYIRFGSSGERICDESENQNRPEVISDDSGGIIVAWQDAREGYQNKDIYASRFDSTMNFHWEGGDAGLPVCIEAGIQNEPKLVPDGSGGAIVAWIDGRTEAGIYAQRISRRGEALWQANGVPVVVTAGAWEFDIDTDGAGGAVIVWMDSRDFNPASDIYAQRLDRNGNKLWVTPSDSSGIPVCRADSYQQEPVILGMADGGAVAAWCDRRKDDYNDIYAQRIGPDGTILWQSDGIPVSTHSTAQGHPVLTCDGEDGFYAAWNNYDGYYYVNYDILGQHFDGNGGRLWGTDADSNGYPLAVDTVEEYTPNLLEDGSGGVFLVWSDMRTGNANIYGQRFDAEGNRKWQSVDDSSGVPISTASRGQWAPCLQPDSGDGIVVVWSDDRDWSRPDIFAQQVSRAGDLGVITHVPDHELLPACWSLAQNYPNPFNPTTSIKFQTPAIKLGFGNWSLDFVSLKVYDILGREVATLVDGVMPAGEHEVRWDAGNLPGGVYFYRVSAGGWSETKKMLLIR
jgi:hypothetical protein